MSSCHRFSLFGLCSRAKVWKLLYQSEILYSRNSCTLFYYETCFKNCRSSLKWPLLTIFAPFLFSDWLYRAWILTSSNLVFALDPVLFCILKLEWFFMCTETHPTILSFCTDLGSVCFLFLFNSTFFSSIAIVTTDRFLRTKYKFTSTLQLAKDPKPTTFSCMEPC